MKQSKWKQFWAFVLAVVLVFTGIPTTAFAQIPATTAAEDSTENTYESNLPVIYINTENGVGITSKDYYVNATMRIQGNDTYSDESILYDGDIEISGRGNSTWGMPKKPYKIKLDKKSNLFNMGKHKRWVLLANYSDETLMRNTLAYNLSGAMGMPQMETVWVDVVLNGEYVGNYQFCEQIKIDDGNRVDIFDWESLAEDAAEIIAEAENLSEDDAGDLEDLMKEEDMSWITSGEVKFNDFTYKISDYEDIEVPAITGGYLLELDEYYDEVSKFKTYSEQPIMFKNPEFVCTNQDMMNYVQTYVQSFENAVQSTDYSVDYNGTITHYSELFDFNSLVDYWLINEIFFNEEINKKSTYMYKDIGGLMYMGPIWDMDYSSGGEGQTWQTNQWATRYYNTNAQANMWYKDLIKDPYFVLKAQERYWEIRNTYVQDMVNAIDTSYDLLKDSADANADIWYKERNFDSHVNNLRSWFNSHLAWLDTQMASENSLLSSLGYETANLTLSATDNKGNALRKDIVSDKAAADVLVNIGESVLLTVSSNEYTSGTADVFVNGKKIDAIQLGATITISAEQLTADYGKKNIIEVKLLDYGKSVQSCITVIETDTSQLPEEPDEPDTPVTSDPEDDSRDYPTDSMTAIADSQYKETSNEGPARYVLDGDYKTHWHTNWDTSEGKDVKNRWIGVELAETIMVDGIRCLPRQSDTLNGTVTSYEIQYRTTTDEDWQTVATGEWDQNDKNWKIVTFTPVEAKYVRIVGVHTYAADDMDAHMSMAEFRVRKAADDDNDNENTKTVTGISLAKAADKTAYIAGETFDPKGLEISVAYSDGTSAVIAYNAVGVKLTPAANAVLTEADKVVTITYAGKTTTMDITVEPKEPGDSTENTYKSNLPVVYINTENGVKITSKEDYVNATMKIQGNDTYSDSSILYDGDIEIRGRGNSTWSMPKKPYKIKLDKKANLFDMGKHKHWVLLANYSDETLMRNTLAYNLSGEMGMPQMETVWVDVVLNGEYVGNYQFCEQIKLDQGKNNRVDIFDWESLAEDAAEIIAEAENLSEDDAGDLEDFMKEEDMSWITSGEVKFNGVTYKISDYKDIEVPAITGGYLLELDEYYDEVSKFRTESNQPIMFKNPEFVYTNDDMMHYVQTYVQSFENAVQSTDYTADYNGTTTHYSELFDFNSLVDYWLISEIFFNEELNKKSTYMYKDIDGLMYMGPIWDMDFSSGGEGQTYQTEKWATVFYHTNAQANMWYKDLIKDPYFILRAQERYWEIRNTYVQDMVDSIDTNYNLLKDSADANADIWYGTHNFDSHVNGLKTWFNKHLTWLDAQMASEASLLTSLGYGTSELKLSLTDSNGNALPRDIISTNVAASAVIEDGQALRLKVRGNNLSGTANVYVNSRKIGTVAIGSELVITAEQLSAMPGEKDIIEVKVAENSTVKSCITVLEKEKPRTNLISECVSLDVTGFTYDGTAKCPQITVTYDGTALTENTDYTVTVSNNIEVGTATVTVTGIGNYKGTVVKTFEITPAKPFVVNKGDLDRAITQATALKAEDYTAASYAAMQKSMDTAKAVMDKKDATQAEVNAAVTALLAAIKGLVKAENTTPPSDDKIPEVKAPTKGTKFTAEKATYKVTKSDLTKGEVSFVSPQKNVKNITIPATVTYQGITFKVTSIEKGAFKKNSKVTKVIIGNNVKTIGISAFESCTRLANVAIGKNVTKIGDKAFKGCKALKKIVIPAKVATISKEAFQNCSKLATITIHSQKLNFVGKNALKGIKSNAKIKVPSKKFAAYKKLLNGKGQGKKVRIIK